MTSKAEAVRAMFTRIARRYDLMNSLMTGGRHHAWRRLTAAAVAGAPAGLALDLATGTGDLALALRAAAPQRPVIGVDFSEAMLREARAKCAARGERGVRLLAADALALPFADKTFACVTSAFLLRNLADLSAGLGRGVRALLRSPGAAARRAGRRRPRRLHLPAAVGRALRDAGRAGAPHGEGGAARRRLPALRPRHNCHPPRHRLAHAASSDTPVTSRD